MVKHLGLHMLCIKLVRYYWLMPKGSHTVCSVRVPRCGEAQVGLLGAAKTGSMEGLQIMPHGAKEIATMRRQIFVLWLDLADWKRSHGAHGMGILSIRCLPCSFPSENPILRSTCRQPSLAMFLPQYTCTRVQ